MRITRRNALLATGAAAITTAAIATPLALKAAGAKAALAGEEAQVLALFRRLGDHERAVCHTWLITVAGGLADSQPNRRWAIVAMPDGGEGRDPERLSREARS